MKTNLEILSEVKDWIAFYKGKINALEKEYQRLYNSDNFIDHLQDIQDLSQEMSTYRRMVFAVQMIQDFIVAGEVEEDV